MNHGIEVRIDASEKRYDRPQVQVNETERMGVEANLAAVLVEKWGMVAGIEDGEDSAGRARLRLATPEEVVIRAFACAGLVMEVARSKGLMVKMPSLAEIDEAAAKAAEAKKKVTA